MLYFVFFGQMKGCEDTESLSLSQVVLDNSFIDGKEATDFLMSFPELRVSSEWYFASKLTQDHYTVPETLIIFKVLSCV